MRPLLPTYNHKGARRKFNIHHSNRHTSHKRHRHAKLFHAPRPGVRRDNLQEQVNRSRLLNNTNLHIERRRQLLRHASVTRYHKRTTRITLHHPKHRKHKDTSTHNQFRRLHIRRRQHAISINQNYSSFHNVHEIRILRLHNVTKTTGHTRLEPMRHSRHNRSNQEQSITFAQLVFTIAMHQHVQRYRTKQTMYNSPPLTRHIQSKHQVQQSKISPATQYHRCRRNSRRTSSSRHKGSTSRDLPSLTSTFSLTTR